MEAVEAHGLSPGGPALSREEWSELVRQLFPSLIDARARMLTFPVIDAFRDEIYVYAILTDERIRGGRGVRLLSGDEQLTSEQRAWRNRHDPPSDTDFRPRDRRLTRPKSGRRSAWTSAIQALTTAGSVPASSAAR